MKTLIALPDRPKALARAPQSSAWYRIENRADGEVEVLIYAEIGAWGITADEFVRDLAGIDAEEFLLRINSPGGEIFDGIAIYNAVAEHKARVTGRVDGLAASAASFILMACDEIQMAENSRLMIHDGHGLCVGEADDMRKMAELLDDLSDNIASIYAKRAGGTKEEWRKTMKGTKWYSAEEAVEVGLADSVRVHTNEADEQPEPAGEEDSFDPEAFAKALKEAFQ